MSPYSCYIKKGLVYIMITDLFSRQSFSCFKYTKSNTYASCDVYLLRETERISYNTQVFDFVHLEQEENWQLDGSVITIHTNPFFIQ